MISTDPNSPQEATLPEDAAVAALPAAALAIEAAPEDTATSQAPASTETATAEADAGAPARDLSPAATGARLAELFPGLFVGPDGKGTWRAIKLRIHADIQARAPGEFSKRTLGIFFSRYTTTTAYLKALAAPGAQRHDLDGQPAGEIAEEHRAAAAEEVARRQAIAAERRAAFRKPAPRAAVATPEIPASESEARAPRERARREQRRPESPRDRPRRDEARDEAPRRGPAGERTPPRQRPPSHRDTRLPPRTETPPPVPSLPVDPAQRERALLLRAFEGSTLSKANFCALKRLSEAELDAQLAAAREERGARKA